MNLRELASGEWKVKQEKTVPQVDEGSRGLSLPGSAQPSVGAGDAGPVGMGERSHRPHFTCPDPGQAEVLLSQDRAAA